MLVLGSCAPAEPDGGQTEITGASTWRHGLTSSSTTPASGTLKLPSHLRRKSLQQQLSALKDKYAKLSPANWSSQDRVQLQGLMQAIAAERRPLKGSTAPSASAGGTVITGVVPTPQAEAQYLAAKAKLADPCTASARGYLAALKKQLFQEP